jgi:L-phenylalanine/L-methionine N-acetyltransferase
LKEKLNTAEPRDAETVTACMSDPAVARGLVQLPHGSAEFWRKRITDMPAGNNATEIMLVAELDGALVGNTGFQPSMAVRRRHAVDLCIAVMRQAQGRGVGSALMSALVDSAENSAGILRIDLNVFVDNDTALTLYKQFGFVHEGTSRAFALRDSQYADVHFLARLDPQQPLLC